MEKESGTAVAIAALVRPAWTIAGAAQRTHRLLVAFALLVILLLAGVACSSDAQNVADPLAPGSRAEQTGDYSVKVWIERDGKRTLVEFGPADSPASRRTAPDGAGKGQAAAQAIPKPGGLRPQANATIEDGDGGILQEGDMTAGEFAMGKQPGWTLLQAAISECAHEVGTIADSLVDYPWQWLANASYSWYFFHEANRETARQCDRNLKIEETLLCAANKLEEVTDTVSHVTWEHVIVPPYGPAKWVIGKQAKRDEFILRDLAVNAIAHLALLGDPSNWTAVRPPYFTPEMASCTDFFQKMNADSSYVFDGGLGYQYLYQPDLLGVEGADPIRYAAFAAPRLRLHAQTLRAAGRLLREVLDKSYYADLAGAENNRAGGGDPVRSTELMWGVREGEDGSYNSLRHVMRLLYGRWELGPDYDVADVDAPAEIAGQPRVPHQDPRCRDYAALDLLRRESDKTSLLSPGFSARWTDREVATTGQALAYSTLLGSGIVIPPASYKNKTTLTQVRDAIEQQLLLDALNAEQPEDAEWIGVGAAFDSFKSGPAGQAVIDVLKGIEDADLVFALDRVWGHFRLLTDSPDTLDHVMGVAGAWLRPVNKVSPLLVASGVTGGVLEGGFPVHDLVADPAAKLGGAQIGSQCPIFSPSGQTDAQWWAQAANDVYAPFQNAFLLGDTLRSRLEQMATSDGIPTDAKQTASLGSAELRTWTGPGRIVARWVGGDQSSLTVRLLGIEPRTVGVDTEAEMNNQVVAVVGQPWQANCVAGLRQRCDGLDDGDWSIVLTGEFLANAALPGFSTTKGHYGRAYEWRFWWPRTVSEVPVDFTGNVYIVSKPRPGGGNSPGRVLAAIQVSCSGSSGCVAPSVTDTLSDYQRDLATKAFGVGARWPEYGNEIGEDSTSRPGAYCIKDVPRNFFVPLENELNSDDDQFEDSWKHYLDMADMASQRADSLAQEMISLGKEGDLRREAAGVELAQECGDFSAVGGLEAENGKVVLPDDDGQLASCLTPKTVDLTFATADPYPDLSGTEEVNAIKHDILLCDDQAKKHALCDKPGGFTYDTLGVVSAPQAVDWPGCADIEAAAADFEHDHGYYALQTAQFSDYMTSSSLLELLASLHLEFDQNGSWRLTQLSDTLMSSYDTDTQPNSLDKYYPACAPGYCLGDAGRWAAIFPMFDPNPQNGLPQQRYEVGQMVQRALWAMAARAGMLPRGTITMPIPVLNAASGYFEDDDFVDDSLEHHGDPIPFQSVYGRSEFVQLAGFADERYVLVADSTVIPTQCDQVPGIPNGLCQGEDVPRLGERGAFEEDRAIIGPAYRMRSEPAHWLWKSHVDTPDWVRDLGQLAYDTRSGSDSSVVLTVLATNDQVNFAADNTESWLNHVMSDCATNSDGVVDTQPLLDGLVAKAVVCDSMEVTDYYATGGVRWYALGTAFVPSEERELGARSLVLPFTDFVPHVVTGKDANGIAIAHQPGHFQDASKGFFAFPGCDGHLSVDCLADRQMPVAGGSLIQPEGLDAPNVYLGAYYKLAARLSLPSVCSPSARLSMFLSHGVGDSAPPSQTSCDQPLKMATQMMNLACLGTERMLTAAQSPIPPAVRSEKDIALLQGWLKWQSRMVRNASAAQIFEGMPAAAVENMKPGATGAVDATGRQGQLYYQLQQAIAQLNQAWNSAQSQLSTISSLLDVLRADIRLANIAGERGELQNQMQEAGLEAQGLALQAELIELDRQSAVQSVESIQRSFNIVSGIAANAAMTYSSGGVTAAQGYGMIAESLGQWLAHSAADADSEARGRKRENIAERQQNIRGQMDLYVQDNQLISEQTGTTVERSFAQYAVSSVPIYEQLDNAVSQISQSASQIRSTLLELQLQQNNAAYHAAGAGGADYFTDSEGNIVKLPVNTVLRRQYDVTRLRYEQALDDAKRLAYMARLAIEQRIAIRLDQINVPVGSLEAPKLWADKVCSMQGVDYKKLREYDTQSTSDAEKLAVSQFADQYVGDYVANLRKFMEFYSTEYPFHEGDDIALLSVRDDLMQPDGICLRDTRNMLLYSDQLWRRSQEGHGWVHRSCEADSVKCLIASPPEALAGGALWVAPEPPRGFGGVSWLRDEDRTLSEGETLGTVSEPDGLVYQSVFLTAKNPYVLSWFDLARAMDGAPAASAPTERYLVSVYDADWNLLAQDMPEAFFDDQGGWSPRRELAFTVPADGWYKVAFRASLRGAPNGSVAIANVQLEEQAFGTTGAGPYEATLATRQTLSGNCQEGGAEDFRAGFDHRCEGDGSCFYELRHPFVIDTRYVNDLTSKLVGKVAAGNYNFRHIDLALNVVGTGVLDCSDQPSSCYADGYVEYALDHDAFRIPLEDYSGEAHGFNFGSAAINRGKALAIERWITNPMSSTDLGLLSQPQFTKVEFSGRPLSGSYRLRVYDRANLDWERVEDIQIVLKYRYWSRIDNGMN